MKKKLLILGFILAIPMVLLAQSIEVTSFSANPVEVNPLTGGNLTVNYKYTSEAGASSNHIYIGLQLLDATNNFKKTIAEITLQNQTAGTDITGSVNLFIGSMNPLSANLAPGDYYQVKMILYKSVGWQENAWSGFWNTARTILQDTSGVIPRTNAIAKGVDVSWMTEMETAGYTWKDNVGNTKELMPLLKEYEINAVRLRVWVNPSASGANGWCDIPDMVNKAKLAKAAGMDVMITIHYSDFWADPSKQTKPAAWVGMSVSELETAVYNHTIDILTALSAEGITPKWVQIGNETNDGMLWQTGKASVNGFVNYAKFVNAGNTAVKTFNSAIKTIVHVSNGNDNGLFQWNIGGLINNSAQFDMIGMSLYPDASNWLSLVNQTYTNMLDMKTRYGKDVIISEVGFEASKPDISYQFLVYMLEKIREANGLGVFYWEPIAYNGWKSYSKGAWDNDKSPSVAMDAFIDYKTLSIADNKLEKVASKGLKLYPNPTSSFITITIEDSSINSVSMYDLVGRNLKVFKDVKQLQSLNISDLPNGIYLMITNTNEQYRIIKK